MRERNREKRGDQKRDSRLTRRDTSTESGMREAHTVRVIHIIQLGTLSYLTVESSAM